MAKEVLDIISEQSGIEKASLFPTSRLEHDLGITGDDVWDIIEQMDQEFSINWNDADLSYYFYPEATGIFWSCLNREKSISIKSFPLTVGHLIKVAEEGEWSQPAQVR